jgi:DNA-directed RNA polymerase specialized sigma24 family protein
MIADRGKAGIEEEEFTDRWLLEQRKLLVRLFLSKSVPPVDIDDLVQESLLVFWEKRSRIRTEVQPQTFLFGIALQRLRAYRRDKGRECERRRELDMGNPPVISGAEIEASERREWLHFAVNHLSPRVAEMASLWLVQGYSEDAVVKAAGIKADSWRKVKHRIFQGLEAIHAGRKRV